jgi:phosphoribosyl 1,2-cyclic phosphodiesterase
MLQNGNYPTHLKARITSGTGHLSNKQTASFLAENFHEDLNKIWLCHLSEENNHPELARKTIETYLNSFGLINDKDYELEVLRRNAPTGPFDLR